ncbi:MAG: CarD family transcriptional regulator [Clostridia bacterium]|nr:CarD family transcriptional regulator [Clostridia bacterium]
MLEVNEVFVYGNNGVCRLDEIRSEDILGKKCMCYILTPVFDDHSKFYVPVNNETLTASIRPVMVKEKLHEMVVGAVNSDMSWEQNDRKRGETFHSIIVGGLSQDLLTVMKILLSRKKELRSTVRRLHSADEKALAACKKIVGEEFAYAFGVDVNDALSHIEQELTAA